MAGVIPGAGSHHMHSRGILGGDGDRPELAAVSSNDDGAVGGGGG